MEENEFPQIRIELEKKSTMCPPEITARIDELLKTTNRVIFIAINGSFTNVGKTYMSRLVMNHLLKVDSHFADAGATTEEATFYLHHVQTINPKPHPGVIVSANFQMNGLPEKFHKTFRESWDKELQEKSNGVIQGVDLWIGIDREDTPFIEKAVADILVRNLGAKDKK